MGTINIVFESKLEPPSLLSKWWTNYGLDEGVAMGRPLAPTETTTATGLRDGARMNLELWRQPGASSSICRLSAQAGLLDRSRIRTLLGTVAGELQAPAPAPFPAAALHPDSFTWIGDWAWTDDDMPSTLTMQQVDDLTASARRGLLAPDGTVLGDTSRGATLGIVDAPRRAVYLSYDYLTPDRAQLEIVEGCGRVPIDQIPGVRIAKAPLDAYSAGLSSDGTTMATIGYRNGSGWVAITDLRTGRERRLGCFDHAFGNEQISFSPDDRWLLVPRTGKDCGAVIIDTSTGTQRSFDNLNHPTCWWVHQGHLGLLSFGHGSEGDADHEPDAVIFNDLVDGNRLLAARIRPQMPLAFHTYWGAEPHADGRILLETSVPSASPDYRAHGVLAVLDLATGELTQIQHTYADSGHAVLRKQKGWHWNSPLQLTGTTSPGVLSRGFAPADLSEWPADDADSGYGVVLRIDFDSPFFTGRL